MSPDQRALVLFSGGQDSTVCLAWALSRYAHVETVGFDYDQRHAVEMEVRPKVLKAVRAAFPEWSGRLHQDHVITMTALAQISATALTDNAQKRLAEKSLPTTFVPGRNLLFFTYGAAIAYRRDLQFLVAGMCERGYSDYPDSRDEVLKGFQQTLSLGMDRRFTIETPLMWMDKAQAWQLAQDVGGDKLVELIRTETHSCYMGVRDKLHAWGRGCGICPACALRAAGWEHWRAARSTPAAMPP